MKLSFWALGILVLVLSNLSVLVPRQAQADTVTLESITAATKSFSAYSAFYACMSSNDIKQGYSTNGTTVGNNGVFNRLNGTSTKIIGFVGNLGGDDGLVYCDEAAAAWYSAAGYGDVNSMMTDLGFTSKVVSQNCGAGAQVACDYTSWTLNTTSDTLLGKVTSIAKSKSIPTSVPTWGRYMLAVSGLQAKCQPSTSITTSGSRSTQNKSVSIVADNAGKLTATSFAEKSETNSDIQVSAFPNTSGGSDSTCAYLLGVVQDSKEGGAALSDAMTAAITAETVTKSQAAICEKLGYSTSAARQYEECTKTFNKVLNSCIQAWKSGATDRTAPFDANVIAACVATDSRIKGYKISQDDIASILSSVQNQVTPDTTTSNPENTDPCSVLKDDVPMRWLACALLTAGSGMAKAFYDMAQQLLYVPTSSIFNDNFTKSAQSFRIIGMALVIIAGLVMIIAQATGSDLVDAYTIKKVLPKLGIALIGMAIALPLLKFAITLTNDLGIAAGDVVLRLGGSSAVGNSATIGDNVGALFVGIAGVTIAGAVWGWAALTFIATAALGLLLGVIVLAVRQMAIVVLVIIAPLAIAASVLPGTDKLWKFWRSTLLSTLMMFPIIMMFLKAGELMASIFGSMASDQDNSLFTVLAAIVYFAPYFMIPLAFKMAGGLMSTVFGMVNDRSKGMFDRMSKYRAGVSQDRRERAGNNSLWDPNSRIQRALHGNQIASWMADPIGNLSYHGRNIPGFKRPGRKIESSINAARVEQTGKLFEELNSRYGYNDKAFRLLSGSYDARDSAGKAIGLSEVTQKKLAAKGLTAGKPINTVEQLRTAASILSESDSESERIAANAIGASLGRLSTIYQDKDMLRANVTGAGILGLSAHGFAGGEDLATSGNILKQSIGSDAAQGIIVQSQLAGVRSRPDLKAGYGVIYDSKNDRFINGMEGEQGMNRMQAILKSLNPQDLAGAKGGAFDALERGITANLTSGDADAAKAQKDQLFNWAGYYSSASADIKARALKYIRDNGMQSEFEQINGRSLSPEQTGGVRAPEEPAPPKKP